MSTIADQLAGALREVLVELRMAGAMQGRGYDSLGIMANNALSAYEASRHAPAVREVNSDDVDAAWSVLWGGDYNWKGGIRAVLNSFRDRLMGGE